MPRVFFQSTRVGLNSSMRERKQSLSLLGRMLCSGDSGREEGSESVKNRNTNKAKAAASCPFNWMLLQAAVFEHLFEISKYWSGFDDESLFTYS